MGAVPVACPDVAWVRVVGADSVAPGGVCPVEVADSGGEVRDLVVWCPLGGTPVVADARCPHQWSHLGYEGVVDGRELVCTSHFWRFDAEGHGSKLNVNGRRDEKADLVCFPAREVDGWLEADL